MFRLLILTFHGSPRYLENQVHRVHESPQLMLLPLVVLAIFSVISGYIGVPPILGGENHILQFLTPAAQEAESETVGASTTETILMAASTGFALAGFVLAYLFYVAKPELPQRLAANLHALYSIVANRYYVDELYDTMIVWPVVIASREFLWKFVDVVMIDGAVNGIGQLVRGTGGGLRHMQSGYVRTYAGWILFGGVLIMAWFLR
jgi:NADH-quinone oxidoreductase subunit L